MLKTMIVTLVVGSAILVVVVVVVGSAIMVVVMVATTGGQCNHESDAKAIFRFRSEENFPLCHIHRIIVKIGYHYQRVDVFSTP